MNKKTKIKLFLVDDDALYLKLLESNFLEQEIFEVTTFNTGEECIASLSTEPDIIILDYNLNGIKKEAMNGMMVLDKVKKLNSSIPVIILSSQDKIEVAIDCMHHKANDYVVKSETAFTRLGHIITKILTNKQLEERLKWYMERM